MVPLGGTEQHLYSGVVWCQKNRSGEENGILELLKRAGPLSHIAAYRREVTRWCNGSYQSVNHQETILTLIFASYSPCFCILWWGEWSQRFPVGSSHRQKPSGYRQGEVWRALGRCEGIAGCLGSKCPTLVSYTSFGNLLEEDLAPCLAPFFRIQARFTSVLLWAHGSFCGNCHLNCK